MCPTARHAFGDDVLEYHDATALAELMRVGSLSHEEVITAAVERARLMAPKLHAVASENYSQALRIARNEQITSAPFAGVPTFIKDNVDVAGQPTRHGSCAMEVRPERHHEAYISHFLSQGFNCLGKSAMAEFALNATTESTQLAPCVNPWNPLCSAGGSSGGSAALVAAGVVPIAHGNDSGGSIRIPASCCGLVGLKPSRGRHVRARLASRQLLDITSEGVLTRTVRDTANFHCAMERIQPDRQLPPIGLVVGPARQRLRIGVLLDSPSGMGVDDVNRTTVEASARLLADQGHTVEIIKMNPLQSLVRDFRLYWCMLAWMINRFGHALFNPTFDPEALEDFSRQLSEYFRRHWLLAPASLLRLRRGYPTLFQQLFAFDAILMPTLSYLPPNIGYLAGDVPFEHLMERLIRFVSFTPLANISGAPAISLPGHLTPDQRPVGVQLMAPPGHDRRLLELAFELEMCRPWPQLGQSDNIHRLNRVVTA